MATTLSLDSEYRGFLRACWLEDASRVQRDEMRRAFFAGAFVALQGVDAGGAEELDRLHAEAEREIRSMIERDHAPTN